MCSATGYVGVTEYQPEHKLSPKWRVLLSTFSSMSSPLADSASLISTAAAYLLFIDSGMIHIRLLVDFPVLPTGGEGVRTMA